jgi:proton-dependent oligopeptide transporter, POT family
MSYRTSPADLNGMPPGIPHIIGNEAAERFSFYGMKGILAIFMANYLHLMDGSGAASISETQATAYYHYFNVAVYATPLLGALLADIFLGKYLTIVLLSLVYCAGHACLAYMGVVGSPPLWLFAGLLLISLGSGGIKPCVSAHVGDQFGSRNAHLLPKIFNWFYFSINIGALVSMLLTPWLLEWHGPHWAFGVPGVLMALATLIFWIGRKRFIHVPPGGHTFLRELASPAGRNALLKLLPLYLFVAIFWALFDQTGSTWIFQAQDMDRRWLDFAWMPEGLRNIELLPSQIQSLNSLFVLTFIPLFAYWLYPAVSKLWNLTPLRKIGLGLFIMVTSFWIVTLVQEWIDAGQRPNVWWQILAYALLTAGEVMISIVALEFAYTQSPKTMKSLMMCYYLGAVALGNFFVGQVNQAIQVPDAAQQQLAQATPADGPLILPGHDRLTGTTDDFQLELTEGRVTGLRVPGQEVLDEAARRIEALTVEREGVFPTQTAATAALADLRDPWGGSLRFQTLNSVRVRLLSDGPDRKPGTPWDVGIILEVEHPADAPTASWVDRLRPAEPWLDRRKRELGLAVKSDEVATAPSYSRTTFSGGQNKLEGAAYFRFFTWLMLGTAIAFIPFALLYRPRTYLQD